MLQRTAEFTADIAQRADLLLHPGGCLIDQAVGIQHSRDQVAQRNQLDQRTQQIRWGSVYRMHVDRIESQHQRQHPESGNRVRPVGKLVQRILNAETLYRGSRSRCTDLRCLLRRVALLDRVRQLMGQ